MQRLPPAELMRALASRYEKSGDEAPSIMTSESREYALAPLSAETFNAYTPTALEDKFRVLAVDSGSVMLFDTPYWGVGFVKTRGRLVEFSPGDKTGKTVDVSSDDSFVLYTDDEPLGRDGNVISREEFEAGAYLKRQEHSFISKRLATLDATDLLLVDGTLSFSDDGALLKAHPNTIGVSKRTGLQINRFAASAYLLRKAEKAGRNATPWFCHPLVKKYPDDAEAAVTFASFMAKSPHAFRVDVPFDKCEPDWLRGAFQRAALFAMDPKYSGYPYPLGAVHSDAVMRPADREAAQRFIKEELLKNKGTMSADAFESIKADIVDDQWYDRFRKRA